MVTCPICGITPATTPWHGVTICTDCREDQRVVDRRLNWILTACTLIIIACMINITR